MSVKCLAQGHHQTIHYGVIGYGKYVEISIGEFGVFRYTNKGAIRCDT